LEKAELLQYIKLKNAEAKGREAEFLWDSVLTLKKQQH